MRLTKQSFEILEQEIPVRKPDDSNESYKNRYLEYMYKHIEKCGRTCYKSEDKITEDSAVRFVSGLIKSRHLSVLEHGAVYLKVPVDYSFIAVKYTDNYSKLSNDENYYHITTNYRVIVENGWEKDLQYLCEPTEFHERRHTVLLHSCIHAYKDLTRHRRMSFSIESTRYCNYSKTDKFGEMKFVLPPWVTEEPTSKWWLKEGERLHQPLRKEGEPLEDFGRVWYEIPMDDVDKDWETGEYHLNYKWNNADIFLHGLKCAEDTYNLLIESGWQPQQAAEVLPQCTAADVVMSGFSSDWMFVFRLRTSYIHETGMPHPLVSEIMDPLYDEFRKRDY